MIVRWLDGKAVRLAGEKQYSRGTIVEGTRMDICMTLPYGVLQIEIQYGGPGVGIRYMIMVK